MNLGTNLDMCQFVSEKKTMKLKLIENPYTKYLLAHLQLILVGWLTAPGGMTILIPQ